MGKSGRGLGLEVMRKSKLKKKPKKRKLLNMMVLNFFYSDSYLFLTLLLLLSFLFSYCPRQLGSGCSYDEQQHTISIQKIRTIVFNKLLLFFLFSHKFQTKTAPTFAHGSKNLYSHIDVTVQILSKSITSNSVIFSFLSYFG